jgi:NADH-quinone oxidoreductase subunit N
MLANYVPSGDDYLRFLPEMIMTAVGTLIMVVEPLLGENKRTAFASISIAGFFAALVAAIYANTVAGTAFSNMLIVDGFATFFRVLVIGVGILTIFSSAQ